MIEYLASLENRAATESVLAMVEAGAHDYDILLPSIRVGEHMPQVIKIARVPYRHQNIAFTHAHGTAAQFLIAIDAELVELFGLSVALLGNVALGNCEDGEESCAKYQARDGCLILGEQIHYRGDEQHPRGGQQAQRYLCLADVQVSRHLPCAVSRFREAQHEHRDGLHGEAPDHPEGVERGQLVDVAAAENDSEQLQTHDQIDDPVAGAVSVVRLLEPAGQHPIFRHAIQDTVGANNGSILRSRQNQHAHQHNEPMKQQLQTGRPHQIHRDAADQVGKIIRPYAIRNNHYGEERNERSEQQAVDKNHQPGLFQVLQLGMFDFTIHLRQCLFAAHGQYRMPEADEQNDPCDVGENSSVQPAQRFFIERNHACVKRVRRQLDGRPQHGDRAPKKQNHHHHRGDDHDLQSFLAGFVNALGIFPPEIKHDNDSQSGGKMVIRKIQRPVKV